MQVSKVKGNEGAQANSKFSKTGHCNDETTIGWTLGHLLVTKSLEKEQKGIRSKDILSWPVAWKRSMIHITSRFRFHMAYEDAMNRKLGQNPKREHPSLFIPGPRLWWKRKSNNVGSAKQRSRFTSFWKGEKRRVVDLKRWLILTPESLMLIVAKRFHLYPLPNACDF